MKLSGTMRFDYFLLGLYIFSFMAKEMEKIDHWYGWLGPAVVAVYLCRVFICALTGREP